jgi:hypothetical protein
MDNMKSGFPVILSVQDINTPYPDIFSGGLHSIIADGYRDNDEYFHLNIGWGALQYPLWYDLPDFTIILPQPVDYDVVNDMIYDICPNQGWSQYGANAQNTFSSVYGAPTGSGITQKWRATCRAGFSFSNILIGTGNYVYAAASTTASSGRPFVYVVDQFGTIQQQIELDRDGNIEFMCQSAGGDIFVAMEGGYIYRVDQNQGLATPIFAESNGDDINSIKIDEEGWLVAATSYRVYALTRTGTLRWSAPFVAPSGTQFIGEGNIPTIDVLRQRIYITYYNSSNKHASLAALNRQTGQVVQSRDLGAVTIPSFRAISLGNDGTLYVRIPGLLYALNADDLLGTPRWSKSILITTTPAVGRDGMLYFPYWEQSGSVWYNRLGSFEPSNGAMRWSIPFQLDPSTEDIFQPYIASNGVVVFSIERNGSPKTYTLHAYRDNGTSAEELWQYNAGVSGGDYAFGPGRTVYAWGKTGLAQTIYALSYGDLGDPFGAGMNYENNRAPVPVSNPNPPDGALDQDTSNLQIAWSGLDPDGNSLTYDIYVCPLVGGKEAAFVPVASKVVGGPYNLVHLRPGTRYLWFVATTDGQAFKEGPIWSFTTEGSITETDPTELRLGTIGGLISVDTAKAGDTIKIGINWVNRNAFNYNPSVAFRIFSRSSFSSGDYGSGTATWVSVTPPNNTPPYYTLSSARPRTGMLVDTSGGFKKSEFGAAYIFNCFGCNGSGVDTIAFAGAANDPGQTAIPPADSGLAFKFIVVTQLADTGKVICIDSSSNFPPTNTWKWAPFNAPVGTPNQFPAWAGIKCWVLKNPPPSDVRDINDIVLPNTFTLKQNYPNPFNLATRIEFTIPHSSHVRLDIFDVLGRRVQTLVDQRLSAGRKEVAWDATGLASGTYFYRLTADDFVETKKMLLLK